MKTPVQIFTVTAAEAGQKLLQYLVRRLDGALPPAALQRLIRTGQVRLDGKRAKPFDRVAEGQKVRMPPFETDAMPAVAPGGAAAPSPAPHIAAVPRPARKQAQPPAPASRAVPGPTAAADISGLDILYEDDELLVVVKPAGLPVHPGSGHATALTTLLHARDPGAPFRPTPAHRLDRDTTGILLVAKSYRMLRRIHDAMLSGEARKDYLAWVRGQWRFTEVNDWITLRDRLAKRGDPGRERVEAGEDGKEAVCKVRLLGRTAAASLLEVRLETGRTQQIRAQLAARGHPIVGDPKYGGGAPPMRLHAWRVTLPDAAFCAPPDWEAPWLVKRLRRATRLACAEQDVSPQESGPPPDAPE